MNTCVCRNGFGPTLRPLELRLHLSLIPFGWASFSELEVSFRLGLQDKWSHKRVPAAIVLLPRKLLKLLNDHHIWWFMTAQVLFKSFGMGKSKVRRQRLGKRGFVWRLQRNCNTLVQASLTCSLEFSIHSRAYFLAQEIPDRSPGQG